MNYRFDKNNEHLKNILEGNISEVKNSMNFEQLQKELRPVIQSLDNDEGKLPIADKLRDLYGSYQKLYELSDKKKEIEGEIKTLEVNKEKSDKKSSKHLNSVSYYSKVSKTNANNKEQYYKLKCIVDEMFR